jgi:uncharacterized protein
MRLLSAIFILLISNHTYAADQPASEASIRRLIEITQASKLMDDMLGQMDTFMQNSMQQALGNRKLKPKQKAIMDDTRNKVVALFTNEMKWESLEPDLIAIYQKSFSEEEVTGMLDFYQTKTGQAVIKKMPVVMQHTMKMMQNRMTVIMPKIQQIQKESIERLKACSKEPEKQ